MRITISAMISMRSGSTRAKAILDDWATAKGKFRKVMPIEYRRALAELNAAMKEAAE